MIKKIEIENYKSLENLSMELGRFNVLIGENGCGKTNILESLVFAAAGMNGIFNGDFIPLRGARSSEPKFCRSGFNEEKILEAIRIRFFYNEDNKIELSLNNDNEPFSKWIIHPTINEGGEFRSWVREYLDSEIQEYLKSENGIVNIANRKVVMADLRKRITDSGALEIILPKAKAIDKTSQVSEYIIYAPENSFMRNSIMEIPFVEPVGYRGEGLLKLIKVIKKEKPEEYNEIISHLDLIDWFDNFEVNEDFNADSEFTLSDKYLEDGLKSFDIRNANEGFLFVLFYLTIFISDYTPKFFAIDNIDTALNPKLCSKLITVLAELAKKHDKQVIITTHNPSVLDGLNLNDDEERLFVIARNKSGRTRATRIEKKPAVNGTAPVKLSEQFLRGYIGGLPKNF